MVLLLFRMKAIQVYEFGGPEVLKYEEVSDPTPGPRQALVAIEVIGVNFIDIYHRTGDYKVDTPFTPGIEAAGRVVEIGPEVELFAPGDRVAYCLQRGSYAEKAAVDERKLVTIPEDLDLWRACAAMCQGMTAHFLSHDTFPLKSGNVALIHAAAGGVGHLLVQMAKMRGATVIGSCSSYEKAELVRKAGADHAVVSTKVDFASEVKKITRGEGVDVVYDSVGKDTFLRSLDCLKPRGYLVLFGQASGAVEPIDPQVLNLKGSLFLTRPSLFHYASGEREAAARAETVFDMILSERLEINLGESFSLKDSAEAHRRLEGRRTTGKVLLIP